MINKKFIIVIVLIGIIGVIVYLFIIQSHTEIKENIISDSIQQNPDIFLDDPTHQVDIDMQKNEEIVKQINDVINTKTGGRCGIYAKNLKTGEEILINANDEFFPASIYKLPLAILILKDVESGKINLDDQYLVDYSHIAYSYDPLANRVGTYVTVSEMLSLLIRNSDNTAQKLMVHEIFGGYEEYNSKIISDLGINGFQGSFVDLSVTPRQVGQLLENLYNDKYLNKTEKEYLVELLFTTSPNFNDRIVSGVPENINVAHKIGQLDNIYQDAAIVYGENDYIIVILNENINSYDLASYKLSQISKIIWNYFK